MGKYIQDSELWENILKQNKTKQRIKEKMD